MLYRGIIIQEAFLLTIIPFILGVWCLAEKGPLPYLAKKYSAERNGPGYNFTKHCTHMGAVVIFFSVTLFVGVSLREFGLNWLSWVVMAFSLSIPIVYKVYTHVRNPFNKL